MSWTGKHIITVLIVMLAILGFTAIITGGLLYAGKAKRDELRVCIQQERVSPIECRLAVYGHVGRD